MMFSFLICKLYPQMFIKEKNDGVRAETLQTGGSPSSDALCASSSHRDLGKCPAWAQMLPSSSLSSSVWWHGCPACFLLGLSVLSLAAQNWRLQISYNWMAMKAPWRFGKHLGWKRAEVRTQCTHYGMALWWQWPQSCPDFSSEWNGWRVLAY